MEHDQRDEIWNAMFTTYYDARYYENVEDKLATSWQCIDEITKVAVAVTASGSAIAGWSLWADPNYHALWVCLAGGAALISVVHAALSVAPRLQDAGDLRRAFAGLRCDIQTCRHEMRIDPEFSVEEFAFRLIEYRRRLSECEQRIKNDPLRTRFLKDRTQRELNLLVEAEKKNGS